MKRNRKIFILFLLCLIVIFVFLIISEKEDCDVDKMPAIVFLNKQSHYRYKKNLDSNKTIWENIEFYDNKGNYYTSKDAYVCSLSIEDLVREYEQEKINDKIEFNSSCGADELNSSYEKLIKVSRNKSLKIIEPDMVPDVELDSETISDFYGVYNTSDGLKYLKLHLKDGFGDYDTNDDLANEIYDWYEAISENKEQMK